MKLEIEILCDDAREPTIPVATVNAVLEATRPFHAAAFEAYRDVPSLEDIDDYDTKVGATLYGRFSEPDVKMLADRLRQAGNDSAWVWLALVDEHENLVVRYDVDGYQVTREAPDR